jgi:hypothetical protein
MMAGKRAGILIGALSIAVLAVTSGAAFAHGPGGRGGDGELFLLAKAAGVSHQTIASAFKSDTALKTDHTNVKNARKALVTCLVSGASCSTQISAYTGALEALEQEKMNVWQGIFKGAPNLSNASTVLGQLEQLHAQRQAIFKEIFGSDPSAADGRGE